MEESNIFVGKIRGWGGGEILRSSIAADYDNDVYA